MKRLVGCVLLLLACGCGKTAKKPYESPELNFSVAFPAAPKLSTHDEPSDSGPIHFRVHRVDGTDGLNFAVLVNDYPENFASIDAKAILDEGQPEALAAKGGKFLSRKESTLDGHPSREYVVQMPASKALPDGVLIRSRATLVRNRLYNVMVAGSKDRVNGPVGDAFLRSFRLLNPVTPSERTAQAPPDPAPAGPGDPPRALPAKPTDYTSAEGGYSVRMPDSPQEKVQPPRQGGVTRKILVTFAEPPGLAVNVLVLELVNPVPPADQAKFLDDYKTSAIRRDSGTQTQSRATRMFGHSTLEFRYDAPPSEPNGPPQGGRFRLIVTGPRVYDLRVIGDRARLDDPAINAFFDSFRLTAPDRAEAPAPAPAPPWVETVSEADRYRAMMPPQVQDREQTVSISGKDVAVRLRSATADGVTYAVLVGQTGAGGSSGMMRDPFEGGKAILQGVFGAEVVRQSGLSRDGRAAQRLRLSVKPVADAETSQGEAFVIPDGPTAYVAVAFAPAGSLRSHMEAVNTFLNSLTPRPKPKIARFRPEWSEFSAPGGNFAIDMPAAPEEADESTGPKLGKTRAFTVRAGEAGPLFRLSYRDLTASEKKGTTPAKVADETAKKIVADMGGAVQSDVAIQPNGHIGRDVEFHFTEGDSEIEAQARVVVAGSRVFSAVASGSKEALSATDRRRFVRSLEVKAATSAPAKKKR